MLLSVDTVLMPIRNGSAMPVPPGWLRLPYYVEVGLTPMDEVAARLLSFSKADWVGVDKDSFITSLDHDLRTWQKWRKAQAAYLAWQDEQWVYRGRQIITLCLNMLFEKPPVKPQLPGQRPPKSWAYRQGGVALLSKTLEHLIAQGWIDQRDDAGRIYIFPTAQLVLRWNAEGRLTRK